MIRIFAATALLLATSDAASAAIACKSAPGSDGYYQYRLIGGQKCWYRGRVQLEKSALAWRAQDGDRRTHSASVRVGDERQPAGRSPETSTLKAAGARTFPDVYAALCGGPCPDFRALMAERFDGAFAPWPNAAVARPPLHLVYPQRVSQAYGARAVTTVAYRSAP